MVSGADFEGGGDGEKWWGDKEFCVRIKRMI
jgi:hypothetical protein